MQIPPLPTRDGVGASCVALPPGSWDTVLEFLVQRFPAVSASAWAERIVRGDVVDEGGAALALQQRYVPGRKLYYYRMLDTEPRIPFDETVLFQDDHLVVADKPHFLPVAPVGKYVQESLLVRLKRRLGCDDLVPLHRIDRETAGLVMFSARRSTRGAYHALFAERRISKTYEAIVPWCAGRSLPALRESRLEDDAHFMRMREVPGIANARTELALIEHDGHWARLRLRPISGRRHQLRVHCAAIGMPIRNDAIYPVLKPEGTDDHAAPLQLLARELAFVDPLSGQPRRFVSRLPLALPAFASADALPPA